MSGAETVAVELTDVRKTFRDFWGRPVAEAVRGVNLTIRRGEIFGLIGPNGSGKSTTVKMILGLIRPTAGTVRLFGADPRTRTVRAKIGYLPEVSCLHPFLTARETLRYYAGLSNLPSRPAKERVQRLLEEMELAAVADRAVGGFSKGMARRVAFASALVAEPELLVLDEPTSGLDPLGVRAVKERVSALARGGMTILLTSHRLPEVQDVADRVAVLSHGRVAGGGTVSEIVAAAADKRHALEDYFESCVLAGGTGAA